MGGPVSLEQLRADAGIVPRILAFAGRDWTLPAVFPLVVMNLMKTGDLDGALGALLGPEAPEMIAAGVGMEDILLICEKVYDLDAEKAGASSQPSNRAARRSKPTSNGSTASTSRKRVSARTK